MAFLASAISMGAIADESSDKPESAAGASAEQQSKSVVDGVAATKGVDADETVSPAPALSMSKIASLSRTDSNNSLTRTHTNDGDSCAYFYVHVAWRQCRSQTSRAKVSYASRRDSSILSDFLTFDADMAANDAKRGKSKASAKLGIEIQPPVLDSLARPWSDPPAGTQMGASRLSVAHQGDTFTKGVFMSPAAGPGMGGFVSTLLCRALLTSVDSGLGNRAPRPSGRRASASSRSMHSDDSKSIISGPRRGSASQAVSDAPTEPEAAQTERVPEKEPDQARDFDASEKARKVKSFGNLRAPANDPNRKPCRAQALPGSPLPRCCSQLQLCGRSRGLSAAALGSTDRDSTRNTGADAQRESPSAPAPIRSPSVNQRLLRRPKTSGAEAGLGDDRLNVSTMGSDAQANSQKGLE